VLHPPVRVDARDSPARRQTKRMHRHRHPARVAVTHLDMAIDHHVLADKAHRAHAYGIAKLFKFIFHFRNARVGIPAAHHTKGRGAFAKRHADVFRSTEANPDDGGLTSKPAFSERHQAIEVKPLDPLNPI